MGSSQYRASLPSEENKLAIEEIYLAIYRTNGYFYDDVKEALKENFKYVID